MRLFLPGGVSAPPQKGVDGRGLCLHKQLHQNWKKAVHSDIDAEQLGASFHEQATHEQTTLDSSGDTDAARATSSSIDGWHFTKGVKDNEGPDMMDIVEEGDAQECTEEVKGSSKACATDVSRRLHARDRARFPVVYDYL